MNPNLLAGSGFHLSLAIGQHLWTDLFSEAFPLQVTGGEYDVNEQLRPLLSQLGTRMNSQMRQLAARTPPLLAPPVERLRHRFGDRVKTRARGLRKRVSEGARINGTWNLNITREGSKFSYGNQSLTVSARVRAVADGTIDIGHGRIRRPFQLQRDLRASFTLQNVRYDKNKGGLVGSIRDMHLELGEHPVIKAAEVWVDRLLDSKLAKYREVTLLQVAQINKSLEDALGQVKFMAAIDDVGVTIDDSNLVLQVNFVFNRKQQVTAGL